MKSRNTILLAAMVTLAVVLIIKSGNREHSSPPVTAQKPAPAIVPPEPAAPAPAVAVTSPPAADTNTRLPEPPAKKNQRTALRVDATPENSAPPAKGSKPPIRDPDARAALASVGVDSEAEEYWIQAINDLSLPAEERKDLIEDLNEDGLIDPHHPKPEDMPIIASRIALIEELAPDAADDVNAKAFAEAYKDLVNLWKGLPAD